mgnify:CR=1 FL=1
MIFIIETYCNMMNLKDRYLSKGGKILEIGSGGGCIKDIYPQIITSDVTEVNNVDMVVDAQHLPFEDNELSAIFAMHVIHHIPDINLFLQEAMRCVKKGGGLVIVEPYWSPVAKVLYKKCHPEPFDEKANSWILDSTGPMSGSNQALSYILLKRDRKEFFGRYPEFELVYHRPFNSLRYLATGGVWLKPKLPQFCFPLLKGMEKIFWPIMYLTGIHHVFVLKRIE